MVLNSIKKVSSRDQEIIRRLFLQHVGPFRKGTQPQSNSNVPGHTEHYQYQIIKLKTQLRSSSIQWICLFSSIAFLKDMEDSNVISIQIIKSFIGFYLETIAHQLSRATEWKSQMSRLTSGTCWWSSMINHILLELSWLQLWMTGSLSTFPWTTRNSIRRHKSQISTFVKVWLLSLDILHFSKIISITWRSSFHNW